MKILLLYKCMCLILCDLWDFTHKGLNEPIDFFMNYSWKKVQWVGYQWPIWSKSIHKINCVFQMICLNWMFVIIFFRSTFDDSFSTVSGPSPNVCLLPTASCSCQSCVILLSWKHRWCSCLAGWWKSGGVQI